MGEMTSKLKFRTAPALTLAEVRTGSTAYEAEAEGVKYRVVGIPKILGNPAAGRTFGAYRVVEGGKLHPAAGGGTHRTRAAAYEQAERDLVEVLRDRAAEAERLEADAAQAHVLDETERIEQAERDSDHPVARAARVWRGEPAAPDPGPFRRIDAAVEQIEQVARELVAPKVDPATDDNVHELLDRIVRRSQYVALREVLAALDGWIKTARHNCVRDGHGSAAQHDDGRLCGQDFDVADFREMVNAAADELRLPHPYRPAADDA